MSAPYKAAKIARPRRRPNNGTQTERVVVPSRIIVTPRLILRPREAKDVVSLHTLLEENVGHLEHMIWSRSGESLDDTLNRARTMRGSFDLDEAHSFSVLLRNADDTEGALIGSCGIYARGGNDPNLVPTRDLGYWLDHRQRGKGYGTELATALTVVAFRLFKCKILEIHCASTNNSSAGVARKLGFTLDATLRRRLVPTPMIPQERDLQIWSMFADEFERPEIQETFATLPLDCFDFLGRSIDLS